MQNLGYEAKGEYRIIFRRYFYREPQVRTFNVHIYQQDSGEINCHLCFRDWMRTHLNDRDAYASLKKNLALQYPDRIEKYCIDKEKFIN